MERLALEDFLVIAERVTGSGSEALAGLPGLARAESALHAPDAGFGGVERYPRLDQKAAVLCSRLIRNHPLPDGNKRIAYACMIELIRRNGAEWAPVAGPTERVEAIERLAAGMLSEDDFAAWLRSQIRCPD